jgi:hypothetical protein
VRTGEKSEEKRPGKRRIETRKQAEEKKAKKRRRGVK